MISHECTNDGLYLTINVIRGKKDGCLPKSQL